MEEKDIQKHEENTSNENVCSENIENKAEETKIETTTKYCAYCGGQIDLDKDYCKKCGKSSIVKGRIHCTKCGEILQEKQKYCEKCGTKINSFVFEKNLNEYLGKIKRIDFKNKKVIGIIGALLVVVLLGKPLISNIFAPISSYLEEGNYEKAYNKASSSNKESVLIENLIANLSADAKYNLKNSDSFKLKEAFYDSKNNKVVLNVQGTNSYGGTVSSYHYYTFDEDDNEFSLYTTVSNFDEEETYSWDDFSKKIEKILKNAAKKSVKEIISNKANQLDSDVVNRINRLNNSGLLDSVELLDEINELYYVESDA